MKGLNFLVDKPITPSAPNRADIACFVGLVGYRGKPLTLEIRQWLRENAWLSPEKSKSPYHRDDAFELLDVPAPIENWDAFDRLFAWESRKLNENGLVGVTYLGAAVRSFFAQGGRKCYVIRVDDPLKLNAAKGKRNEMLEKILPGYPNRIESSPLDRTSWRGIGHLLGLPDVSFVSAPDLPSLLQSEETRQPEPLRPVESLPERFVECSDPAPPPPEDKRIGSIPPPRCDDAGYAKWGEAVHWAASFIAENLKEAQWVASIPLPHPASEANGGLLSLLNRQSFLSESLEDSPNIASAFVQLSYPWLKTEGSGLLPGNLEPPEGSLIGMLARNALTRGTFYSAVKTDPLDIKDLFPKLGQSEIYAPHSIADDTASYKPSLVDRVSLFAFAPQGIQLLSDVTASNQIAYRPASVNRMISLLLRAARRLGEEIVFEPSGEQLWSRITSRLSELLLTLFHLGALRGKDPSEAYHVRCDRSTMTQQDIDSGRVIAQIIIEPAAAIETIDILLSMEQSGQVSLRSLGIEEAVA